MVAQQHPVDMPPAVTVLQLDTHFPRIAGDVGALESYRDPVEIIRVPQASVMQIVSDRPDLIDIKPFQTALRRARGEVVVTSCGFLSYWQIHLQKLTDRPFISSSLVALNGLAARYAPEELMIVTFDAAKLTALHLGVHPAYVDSIIGLPERAHLRDVISQDLRHLDRDLAARELVALITSHITPAHKHILFECTNLPPYRAAVQAATGLPVTDILSEIEKLRPDTVAR